MSTRAFASAVFPNKPEKVWAALREFTFPAKLLGDVTSCEMKDNASSTSVGGVRVTKWKTGEERQDRLLEVSDLERRISWELVSTNLEHGHEVTAQISTIKLYRISENDQTLVEWSADFSHDVTQDFINFNQNGFLSLLKDIRDHLKGQ
eukprot:TRINITY_DN48748_c0_g1_i1.p2 TRINITY_DN48748_c0_g1~~TRINITY_DN48748_c0_g1_i1.p2  ORF type:complete len:149 (+),score=25.73 TRINITY_DN48748_c0_g1_i1:51-497(+)